MKYQINFFILLFFTLSGCIESEKKISDDRTDKEIDSLIQHHKSEFIFSSFWPNMSELDFKRVVQFENKEGILSDGQYNFTIINKNLCSISIREDEKNVLFDLEHLGQYVKLRYANEYWVEKQSEKYPKNDGTYKAKYYNCIIENLVEHFDSKYERIVDINPDLVGKFDFFGNQLGLGVPTWRKTTGNDIVISLTTNVSYFDKNSKSWYRETKEEKELLAKCQISIIYKSYKTYSKEKEEKRKKEDRKKEKKKFEKKKAEEKNDIL